MSEDSDISKWRAGDRAYISGDPTSGSFHHGDIVRVSEVGQDGKPRFGSSGFRGHVDCKPLRVLRAGETIPKGVQTRNIRFDGSLADYSHTWGSDTVQESTPANLRVLVSLLVDTHREEQLKRIAAMEDAMEKQAVELKALKESVK